jgi:heme/copper-type cytochrome/quinol oxidase subunit 2
LHIKSQRPALALALALVPALASADPPALQTRIQNHRFSPAEIHVPANTPVLLTVTNADATAEEFDSPALKVEKVLGGGASGAVHLRPLRPGRYPFTGEYHADTAVGVVVAQ